MCIYMQAGPSFLHSSVHLRPDNMKLVSRDSRFDSLDDLIEWVGIDLRSYRAVFIGFRDFKFIIRAVEVF